MTEKITEKIRNEIINDLSKTYDFEKDESNNYILLGEGGEGCVYEAKTKKGNEIAIKISKSRSKTDVSITIKTVGGGFTKPIRTHKIKKDGKTYYVEIYKKRAKDLYKSPLLPDKNKKGEEDEKYSGLSVVIQTAFELKKLHDRGIGHFDFKPQNIFISKNGNVSLADFGLTNLYKNKEVTMFEGSPQYLAPEMFMDSEEDISGKADVYSFGVTMFEMLTGKSFLTFVEKNREKKFKGREKAQQYLVFISKGNIPELTAEDIKLDHIFPEAINLNEKDANKLKNMFVELVNGALKFKVKDRLSTDEVIQKLIEIANYIQTLKTKDNKKIDLKNDVKLRDKDLFNMGFVDETNLSLMKDKYIKKMDLILNYHESENKEEEKKNSLHLQTVLGKEEDFYPETIECFRQLRNCIDEDGNITITEETRKCINDNFDKLEAGLSGTDDKTKKRIKKEQLLIIKAINELEDLKLATLIRKMDMKKKDDVNKLVEIYGNMNENRNKNFREVIVPEEIKNGKTNLFTNDLIDENNEENLNKFYINEDSDTVNDQEAPEVPETLNIGNSNTKKPEINLNRLELQESQKKEQNSEMENQQNNSKNGDYNQEEIRKLIQSTDSGDDDINEEEVDDEYTEEISVKSEEGEMYYSGSSNNEDKAKPHSYKDYKNIYKTIKQETNNIKEKQEIEESNIHVILAKQIINYKDKSNKFIKANEIFNKRYYHFNDDENRLKEFTNNMKKNNINDKRSAYMMNNILNIENPEIALNNKEFKDIVLLPIEIDGTNYNGFGGKNKYTKRDNGDNSFEVMYNNGGFVIDQLQRMGFDKNEYYKCIYDIIANGKIIVEGNIEPKKAIEIAGRFKLNPLDGFLALGNIEGTKIYIENSNGEKTELNKDISNKLEETFSLLTETRHAMERIKYYANKMKKKNREYYEQFAKGFEEFAINILKKGKIENNELWKNNSGEISFNNPIYIAKCCEKIVKGDVKVDNSDLFSGINKVCLGDLENSNENINTRNSEEECVNLIN